MQRDSRSNSQPHPFYRVSPPFPSPSHPTPPFHPTTFHPPSHPSPPHHPLTSPTQSTFLFPPSPSSLHHPLDLHPSSSSPSSSHEPHPLVQRRSPHTPHRSPPQPVPRLSMLPPAVNYSESYTFPPTSTLSSSLGSNSGSLLPSSQSSPSSAHHRSGPTSPPSEPTLLLPSTPPLPPFSSPSAPFLHPSPQQAADRLDSLRPDALQLAKSSTSPLQKLPHSISLPVLPPPAHQPPPVAGLAPPGDADVRALDSSIGILQMIVHNSAEGEAMSGEKLRRHLTVVLDALTGLRGSSFFRSSSIHQALFHSLALRRSTSETTQDQEVVDWISHEYLTPRRGSTSSDGGAAMPLSHSVSHASTLQAHHHHSHSAMHQPPMDEYAAAHLGGQMMRGGRRGFPVRSNSLSSVTLRSGSHPSLDSHAQHDNLPTMTEARAMSPLVRATNLIRIIRRMASSRQLSKAGIAEEEMKEREGEEKSTATTHDDLSRPAITPRGSRAGRRKSHLDLPTSTSPLVHSSAANISAPFPPPQVIRSPSSKGLVQSSLTSSPISRSMHSSRQLSAASPQATPSKGLKKPPLLISPSSSSPSPLYHSSPSSANKSMSRSRSSSSTPSTEQPPGPLYYSLLDKVMSDPLQSMLAHVDEWSFDIFAFAALAGPRTLSCLLCYLFDELSIFDKFSVKRETFAAFIATIEDGYNSSVPYHNNVHAADVLLNTYFLLQTHAFSSCVTSLDVFASLIAASVHDYAHPGTNNAFQIATQSDFALRYNDSCVLESFHCSEAFFILKRPDHNILEGLTPVARAEVRSTIIHQVLATDMQQHFKNLAELQAEVDKKRTRRQAFDLNSSADRLILLANGLHCADLGNPCKPLPIYLQWTERLIDEFHRQGDREKELGLPISLMMDRTKPNVERSQIGFMDVVVQPLWATLADLAPELVPCLELLQQNRDHWQRKLPPVTPRPRGAGAGSHNNTPSHSSASNTPPTRPSAAPIIVPAMS